MSPTPDSMSTTSWAKVSPPAPTANSTNCPTSNSPTCIGFATIGFHAPTSKSGSATKYGYELGVPVNWSAYEDIAAFFTDDVKEIDGVRVYGHMDYGKRAPDLGWRMTDAWLSMAGAGSKGLPNGRPVDEWGIRMEADSCNPAGASVARGGGRQRAGRGLRHSQMGRMAAANTPRPARPVTIFINRCPLFRKAIVAQQIFWYTAFTSAMVAPRSAGNNTVDSQGAPLWRMAPSPHGPVLGGRAKTRLSRRRLVDAL